MAAQEVTGMKWVNAPLATSIERHAPGSSNASWIPRPNFSSSMTRTKFHQTSSDGCWVTLSSHEEGYGSTAPRRPESARSGVPAALCGLRRPGDRTELVQAAPRTYSDACQRLGDELDR